MAKEKDATRLMAQDELCHKAKTELHMALFYIESLQETTRETALARTRIDEAEMWLDKFYDKVLTDLANKTRK